MLRVPPVSRRNVKQETETFLKPIVVTRKPGFIDQSERDHVSEVDSVFVPKGIEFHSDQRF